MAGLVEGYDSNLPTEKECDNLCQIFTEITGENWEEARMFLQQHDWDLDKSFLAYFDPETTSAVREFDTPPTSSTRVRNVMTINLPENMNKISLLTWNFDGLDKECLVSRTHNAVRVIIDENPDIVYLQEVVPRSWATICYNTQILYHTIPAFPSRYFTAILLKKNTVRIDGIRLRLFPSSRQGRKLQVVNANVKGVDVKLMNSHLESTRERATERQLQLSMSFDEITNTDPNIDVLFGGDLNLRHSDLARLPLPHNMVDAWEARGSRSRNKYTWDMRHNDNMLLNLNGFQPRCRFDRIYWRAAESSQLQLVDFQLKGKDRILDCDMFVSDHWAILCKFHINRK